MDELDVLGTGEHVAEGFAVGKGTEGLEIEMTVIPLGIEVLASMSRAEEKAENRKLITCRDRIAKELDYI